jgi:hypothetical protein
MLWLPTGGMVEGDVADGAVLAPGPVVVLPVGDFGVVTGEVVEDASRLQASKSSCFGEPCPIDVPAATSTLAVAIVAIQVFIMAAFLSSWCWSRRGGAR